MKVFITSLVLFGGLFITSYANACPQEVRRVVQRERIIRRPVVQRQVVRERIVHKPVVRERIIREEYSAPVIVEEFSSDCGCENIQRFRREFRSY